MTKPPAPEGVLCLVKCNCDKLKCSNHLCSCLKAGLNCTELCGCSADEDTTHMTSKMKKTLIARARMMMISNNLLYYFPNAFTANSRQ